MTLDLKVLILIQVGLHLEVLLWSETNIKISAAKTEWRYQVVSELNKSSDR